MQTLPRNTNCVGEPPASRPVHKNQRECRPTRWRREQRRKHALKASKGSQAEKAVAEEMVNKALRTRAAAMEHVLFARDTQLSILASYRHLSTAGATTVSLSDVTEPDDDNEDLLLGQQQQRQQQSARRVTSGSSSREAQELCEAATAPCSVLVRVLQSLLPCLIWCAIHLLM